MSLTITIPGAVNVTTGSTAPAVLTIGVGVPGAAGPQGPAGPGVPTGGTAGQFLTKIDGTNYNTDWTTVNLSVYAVKANNLSDLTSASTARTNLGLGTMATASAADYSTTTVANGLYYPLSGNPSSFLTASALTGYATQSFVAANYAPIAAGLPTGGTVGQVLTKNSGTDYDDSWQTLIPGDRYLTTSTTSNTIGNGAKTFTVGTGLSYSSQQDVVISYDASNHMHAVVTSYNSGTGVLVVDVRSHTGSGTYTSWTVNVGGTTPLQTVEWGEILGVLGDQGDLATALNSKLETSTAASTYAALAGATFTGEVITPASTTSNAGLTITPGVAPSTPTDGEIWATTTDLQIRLNGVTETLAEQSWVTAGFYPLTGNPSSFLVAADITGKANLSGATFTGLVGTVASTTTTAGLNVPHGAAPTTPVNGDIWTTTTGLFMRQNGVNKQYVDFDGSQTINGNKTFSNATSTFGSSTATGTIGLASGATISGSTKTLNIGTGGVAGSTTLTTIGPVLGASTTSIGNTTAASTLNLANGATTTGLTKTVTLGTSGLAGSTTNITIGSAAGTSTTTLNGTTNGVTAAADTNSVALATTAYVVGQAGSATPLVDGTAAVGTSLRYARQDHVHPTDTSRAALNSPAFTGTPSLPTGTTAVTQTAGTNNTTLATTAFVTAAVPAFASLTEARQFSNTTKVLSPSLAMWSMLSADIIYIQRSNFTTTNVGSVQYVNAGSIATETRLASAASSSSRSRTFGPSQVDQSQSATVRSNISNFVNFSLRTFLGGRSATFDITDPVLTMAFYYGKAEADGVGDLTRRGMGWKVTGGTGSRFLTLQVHNGTTLTSVTSSFAVIGGQAFDWDIISDGAGNVTLYVNGSSVATSSAGPTGLHNLTPAIWQEEYSTSGVPAITYHTSYQSRGRMAVINY